MLSNIALNRACMPYMHALHAYLTCMPYMGTLHVYIIFCMHALRHALPACLVMHTIPCMHALHAFLTYMTCISRGLWTGRAEHLPHQVDQHQGRLRTLAHRLCRGPLPPPPFPTPQTPPRFSLSRARVLSRSLCFSLSLVLSLSLSPALLARARTIPLN